MTRNVLGGTVFALASLLIAAVAAWAGSQYAQGDAEILLRSVGVATRLGLPLTAVVGSTAAALTLGGTTLAGWLLPLGTGDPWASHARRRAMNITAASAIVWTLASLLGLVFSYSLSAGQPLGSPRFGSDIGVYMVSDLGVWMLWGTILAAATSAFALVGTSARVARLTAAAAIVAIGAKGMTGHAAGSASHESATSSMFLHLLAVGAWVGPLVIMQFLPADDAGRGSFRATVRRFSVLALGAWVLLAYSGAIALVSRVNSIHQVLTHPYGQLGGAKILILLALAGFGVAQRRVIARHARSARHAFATLAAGEMILMGAAIGLGAAMSSAPPPAESVAPPSTPAGILTTYVLPPDPATPAALVQWRPDVLALALAGAVLWWAVRSGRLTLPLGGALLASVILLSGPLAVYARVLFSAHLGLTAALMGLVGFPLAYTLPAATIDRVRSLPARWALALGLVPAAWLCGAYVPVGVMRAILESHPAHVAMTVGSVGVGVLVGALCRADAAGAAAVAFAGIAAFGVGLASTGSAIAPGWFGATGRTWMANALNDQHNAGTALAVAGAVLAIVVGAGAARNYFSKSRRAV